VVFATCELRSLALQEEDTAVTVEGQKLAWDAWDSVFVHTICLSELGRKRFLGSRSPRICRFCDRNGAEKTFRREAHVIPAALGNRVLLSYEECDECNEKVGSPLEDDLAKFLGIPRAVCGIPSRQGMPKIRHPNEEAFIQSNREGSRIEIYQPHDQESIVTEDKGDGNLVLTATVPKFRPLNVARALGRMTLFDLPRSTPGRAALARRGVLRRD
jgi:hypothetical protein